MNWRSIIQQAREQAQPFLGEALRFRREHPGIFAKAHALAADYHRAEQLRPGVRGARKRLWHAPRARWHRMWRRYYQRKAEATAEAEQCGLMMRQHDRGA